MYTHTRTDKAPTGRRRAFFSKPSAGAQSETPFFVSSVGARTVQPQLAVGSVGDPFEQEADAVAEHVVQREATGAGSMAVLGPVRRTLAQGTGGGHALQPAVREQMESAFGEDFSSVRVHAGPTANVLSRRLGANAFTYGTDIYFDSGKFQPDTSAGRRLLAHELTHVVQQAHHAVSSRTTEPVDSHAEREAHDVSARVARGERAPVTHAVPGGIARDVGWAQRGPLPDPYGIGYNTILTRAGNAAAPAVRDLSSCENARMGFDVASFQRLPVGRRRAVLNLHPHLAGTACESWFSLLEPARLTDAQIEVTPEFQDYMNASLEWQTSHRMTREEALLAGRLILRDMREGRSIRWNADAGAFMNLARRQLGVLRATERQLGDLNWVPFNTGAAVSDPATLETEFGRWALAGGPEPDAVRGRINCWEMVLFGAYRGGFLSFLRIKDIYRLAVDNVLNRRARFVGDTVESQLRRGSVNTFVPGSASSPEPLPGDMIIFNTAANHAAISLGTKTRTGHHEVLSLWSEPNAISHVQKTTIEALLAVNSGGSPVKFWSAKW